LAPLGVLRVVKMDRSVEECVSIPRVLSIREWMDRYGEQPVAESARLTVTNIINGPRKGRNATRSEPPTELAVDILFHHDIRPLGTDH
jgi:hypothetical protein